MSSFRDKLNNKLSLANNKPSPQKVTAFDESWLKISVVGGQTQLCPIKLNCAWAYPNVNSKTPELSCKWFNKTQNSMNIIEGVGGSYYQPSLADVATIIHVQCVPYLEGVEYQGMPIIKEIGPIKIDPETEQEANQLLAAKKAIFSIKIKNGDTGSGEALIKIKGDNLRILKKVDDHETDLMNLQISEAFILQCLKSKPKEVEIKFKEHNYAIQLSSNKIRDVLLLLVKLIAINKEQQVEQNSISLGSNLEGDRNTRDESQPGQFRITNEKQGFTDQITQSAHQNKNINGEKEEKENEKQQISRSEYDIGSEQKDKKENMKEVKSSEQLILTASPVSQKDSVKQQQHSQSMNLVHKQSALETLQITDLKKQLRAKEGQIYQLNKTIGEKNEKIENLYQEINRMKEREANLNCNYFQVEAQVKKIRESSEKISQEISYYKNQNRILKIENESCQKKIRILNQQIAQFSQKWSQVTNQTDFRQQEVETYGCLKEKYERKLSEIEGLYAKYSQLKNQVEKTEEKNAEIKEQLQQIETQRNFYKKKYESITQQLYSSQGGFSGNSSPTKLSQNLKQKIISSKISSFESSFIMPEEQKYERDDKSNMEFYEKEILELKRQLKDSIEENNFLRSVSNGVKDKKSSSKQHLKMELAEMKKIVNRLTQTVTEKDLAIANAKLINKDLSDKLNEAKRHLEQHSMRELKDMSQSIKQSLSFN